MKTNKAERMQLWLGKSIDNTRVKNDFYETPPNATQLLLDNETFDKTIWECSCGKGAISKVLISNGYETINDDLVDRGYGNTGLDFLKKLGSILSKNFYQLVKMFIFCK